jgi:hypothetical protein
MSTRTLTWLCSTLLVLLAVGTSDAEQWKTFHSNGQHFSVHYPSSWHRLGAGQFENDDVLGIINFPNSERVEGVVIKAGGAAIQVSAAPRGVNTLTEWIRRDLQGDQIIRERDVVLQQLVPNGCTALKEVTWRSDVSGSGKAYQLHASYYCSTAIGLYSVFLTAWDGDPEQRELESLSLSMALSLRVR